ncbi:MAG: ComEC/Rec2 family competence protein [Bifidobacteriaceae bacterium]|jgi:competence protein ComEC|nr:ComEC/Rec2 family competence protein [Bifidobacteriaceae bacterium]
MTKDFRLLIPAAVMWGFGLAYGFWPMGTLIALGVVTSLILGIIIVRCFKRKLTLADNVNCSKNTDIETNMATGFADPNAVNVMKMGGYAPSDVVNNSIKPISLDTRTENSNFKNRTFNLWIGQSIMSLIAASLIISASSLYGVAKNRGFIAQAELNQTPLQLIGRVSSDPLIRMGFSKNCTFYLESSFVAEILTNTTGGLNADVTMDNSSLPIRSALGWGQNWKVRAEMPGECNMVYGDTVLLSGTLTERFNSTVDAQFKAKTDSAGEAALVIAPPNKLDQTTNLIRAQAKAVLNSTGMSSRGLVLAMALGDENLMEADHKDLALTSGLTHLLVVSGGHFIILLSIFNAILKHLRVHRYALWVASLAVMIGLMALVHPQDSLMRASLMCLISISSFWMKRRAQSVAALSVTVILLLLIWPNLLVSISLALSVSSTAGIVLLAPIIKAKLRRHLGDLVAEMIAIPLSAMLCSTPVILLINDFWPTWGILANLLASPLVTLITVLGFFGALTAFIPGVGWALMMSAGFFGQGIELILDLVNILPFARIAWPMGWEGSLLFIGLILTVVGLFRLIGQLRNKYRGFEPSDQPNRLVTIVEQIQRIFKKKRYLKVTVTALILLPLLGLTYLNKNLVSSALDSNWLVVGCDVGQGDSFVVNLGQGHAIVIDVGREDQLVDQCLKDLQVQAIDLLVLSHFHDDHVGGLRGAITDREVKQLWVSNSNDEVAESQSVFNLLQQTEITYTRATTGLTWANLPIPNSESVIYADNLKPKSESLAEDQTPNTAPESSKNNQVLDLRSSSPDFLGSNDVQALVVSAPLGEDREGNDASVILYVKTGEWSMVFLGDAEPLAQTRALEQIEKLGIGQVDIVKVAHHGSKYQYEPLYQHLSPRLALIGVGQNTYGHPHQDTLNMLNRLNTATFDTYQYGLIGLIKPSEGEPKTNASIFLTKNPEPDPT